MKLLTSQEFFLHHTGKTQFFAPDTLRIVTFDIFVWFADFTCSFPINPVIVSTVVLSVQC